MGSIGQVQRFPEAAPLLHDYLGESARRLPDKVALVCGEQRLAYGEIDARANALAAALASRGVSRGDRVVVYADNTVEAVVSFWAVLKANAVVSIVNSQTKTDKLAHLINDCHATALISDLRHRAVLADGARRCPTLKAVVVSGLTRHSELAGVPGLMSWNDALESGAPEACPPRIDIDMDLASIIYTSGSTGEPKGIMLTHRNMIAAATSITAYLENTEDDIILCALPFSFDYGLYQMIMAFRMGATLVLERSFTYLGRVLETVVAEKVTGFPGVPTMFALMAGMKGIANHDFGRVRYVTSTGAALAPGQIEFLKALFPLARIYSMYGLSECKRCTYLPPEDLDRKPASVGIPIPNTEMWIVDEHDTVLGPHQVGQLVVRGATVMKGYWNKPEETARWLRPGPLPGEHVLYTGDYCQLDEEGYLYFVARMDDIIKTRGEKVAPKEVENAILDIPGVREAAVVGTPDPVLGEAVKAFVVVEEGAALSEKKIQLQCLARLENYMVPSHVVLVPRLPKTASGKIDKLKLAR